MADNKNFDPYDTFKKFSDQWEKQMNDMIHLWTNNREFVQFSRLNSDYQNRYAELMKKNQEVIANQLDLPTKKDLANIAKLSIQTDEKLDSLEEQIWNLQDTVSTTNKDIENIVEISSEIVKLTKQLKQELTRTKKELAETKHLRTEFQSVKSQLEEITSLREEIGALKSMMGGEANSEVAANSEEDREILISNPK